MDKVKNFINNNDGIISFFLKYIFSFFYNLFIIIIIIIIFCYILKVIDM